MKVLDVRSQLPFVEENLPYPSHHVKDSLTVHWTGGSDTVVTDEEALASIVRWTNEHINKDWAPEIPGVQGGASIMYAEVIAPSGTVFITRDPESVCWHSSSTLGNANSIPILIICDQDDLPTAAQYASLESRIQHHGYEGVHPHQFWVATACPGPQIMAYLNEREDDDMFTENDRAKLDKIFARMEVQEDLVWIQRFQDWLSKVLKSIFRNADFSGPDVTTGEPKN